MGKVNACLKWSYITVVSLILIVSALLLAFTLFSHGYLLEDEMEEVTIKGLYHLYIVSIISLVLALIGLFGAYKEKKWALIVFAVGMILWILSMILMIIGMLALRPMMREKQKMQYLTMLPFENATESIVDHMRDIQIGFQCCGLDQGYRDWGDEIPESCLCEEDAVNPCVQIHTDNDPTENPFNSEDVMIYNQSCLPHVMEWYSHVEDGFIGVLSGIIIFWIFAVVLCICILCQLNKKEEIPVVVFSQEAKAGNYTALSEPAEFTLP